MLPLYVDMEPPNIIKPDPLKTELAPSQYQTQTLLKEFETILGSVNNNMNVLTPPQSPSFQQSQLLNLQPVIATTPEAISFDSYYQQVKDMPVVIELDNSMLTTSPVSGDCKEVDDFVRSMAESIMPLSPDSGNSSGDSGSGSSNFGDCSSDDPEWIPETVDTVSTPLIRDSTGKSRKRSKPYTRVSPEDKKSRKKEQNKNAATRYRQKKKAEVEEIQSEERELQKDNEDLGEKITDLQREIKYLKGLMRDLFRAKGLID